MTSTPANGDRWLTRIEVAERLRVPPRTPGVWASRGIGPKYHRFGRHCRYRLSDVIAWENDQFSGGTQSATDDTNPAELMEAVTRRGGAA